MCKYFDDDTGYNCPHEKLEDNDYCIFHLQDDNKDVDEFNKAIDILLETEEDSIHFNGFYFPSNTAIFTRMDFKKHVNFMDTTFSGEANFFNATFSRGATFINAKFNKMADFTDANFPSGANFLNATFSDLAIFELASFSSSAFFSMATFNIAYFRDTDFLGDTNFVMTKFIGEAHFKYASFSFVNFGSAKFLGKAYFKDTIFVGETDFRDATISEQFVLIPDESKTGTITIDFYGTYFSDSVRIKANMSKCSFANSNIERVDMTDSSWIRNDKPKNSFSSIIKKVKNKVGMSEISITIWEEYQGELKSNWKELEGIYRRLKQSSQKYGDNSTAGKFYYQEMECQREQLKGMDKFIKNVFKLCGYGEKPFNVIWASLFLVFASAYLYLFGGIEFVGSSILKVPPNVIDYNLSLNSFGIQWALSNIGTLLEDFWLCLYTSVITFTTLGYGDVRPIGLSRVVASVEAGFGIIMTALFIFVFTRKMLR